MNFMALYRGSIPMSVLMNLERLSSPAQSGFSLLPYSADCGTPGHGETAKVRKGKIFRFEQIHDDNDYFSSTRVVIPP